MDKKLTYGYDDQFLTHQPRVVFDTITSLPYNLYWDANGNLHAMSNCKLGVARFHDWDEENRLHAVVGPSYAGFYGYDGNGSRIWKLTGSCNNTSQNGGMNSYNVYIDDAVLYPNPYITITPQGYTKHFYLGSERISMAMGEGGWNYVSRPLSEDEILINKAYFEHFLMLPCDKYSLTKNEDIEHHDWGELQYSCGARCLSLNKSSQYDLLYNCISSYQQPTGHSEATFFTHSDHLGSASWITDEWTHPIQYIHYAPYGELLANQNQIGITHNERYKFTGKERDAESGYDYFGARFLAQQLGIWTTPDPLLDKYIFASPYMYCNGNPIKFVDPNGREATISYVISKYQKATERNANKELKNRSSISSLNSINNDYTLVWAHGAENGTYVEYAVMSAETYGNIEFLPTNYSCLDLYNVLIATNASFSKEPNNAVVVFLSCNTGKGKSSFASEFSKLTPESVIIAPTDKVAVDKNGRVRVRNNGRWNVFVNGKVVDTIKGSKGALEKYLQENSEKSTLLNKYAES